MLQDTLDLYAVLGLAKTASPEEIKKAYRKLARLTHPDVLGNTSGEERFKTVTYAYEVLSDPARRALHDRTLQFAQTRTHPSAPSYPNAQSQSESVATDLVFYAQRDKQRLDREWEDFISTAFHWSERAQAAYLRWEWAVGLVTLPVFYLIFTGRLGEMEALTFVFSKASAPGVDNLAPVMGAIIGAACGWGITAIAFVHARWTHRYSYRHNLQFRSQLMSQTNNMFGVLNLIGAVIGLLLGHYLP